MRVKNYLGLKNKWITLFFLSICFIGNAQTPDASNTLYVNINVVGGTGDGSSWANAIPQLSDALKYARLQYNANNAVYDAQPLKIFVAKGTYKPLYSARNNYFTATGSATPPYSDRENAFVMVKNVQIYGGFDPDNGIDDLIDTRIFGANGSVLSGEIGIDDGNGGWPYDNARHIVIASGDVGNAVLNGFTIRDAYSEGTNQFLTVFIYPVQDAFGAMYCVRSSPTVENCIFTNNQNYGGTLFNYQISSPTVTNCTFIKNGVQNNGGAMFNAINCSPTITNCNFTNNAAVKFGGAIYNSDNSSPTITHCSFKNNSAGDGGVIYNSASSPIITNALFANNKATASGSTSGNGGAIYNETTSSPILTNVTIANNTGANTYYSTGAGSTTFNNSIVYGAVSASYTAQYSLVQGYAGGTNGNLDGTSITAIDVFNYFSGGNLTLKIGSPAVNAGSNALFSGLDGNTLDLLKNPRVYDFANGGIIDLGAYEFNHLPDKMLYVNINVVGGTVDGSSWENAIPQLADALKYARQQYDANNDVYEAAPLKIYVAKGTYKPLYGITNSNQDQTRDNAFVMMKNVQIYGGFDPDNGIDDLTDTRIFGANGSVLSGNIGDEMQSNDNTYHIVVSSNEVGNALLDGFYLTGAYSTSSDNASYISLNNSLVQKSRGAFACAHSSPTITNCFFDNNSVGLGGAGISNSFQSSPIITNCTFSSNYSAFRGGAIYNTDNSYPTITNCSFNNNSSNTAGGAIYNDVSSPVITNCSFTNNSSKEGGAVYNSSSSSAVTNTLFANNVANGGSGNGGAIYNEGTSSPVMTNVTIANNTGANTFYSTNSYNTTFNNSIVYGTVSATYTAQYSLIEGNAGGTNGNLDGTTITKAEVFNDNVNKDYSLFICSAVADKGDNSLFAGLNGSTKDLAGNTRMINSIIDLGAYESQPIVPDVNGNVYVTVTGAGTRNGSSWSNATSKLQCAIDATGAQKVLVATGNYNVGSSSFVMKNNVAIYGGFDPANGIDDLTDTRILPNPTTNTEGSILNGLNTRPLIWNFGNGITNSAVLDGFTLKNGSSAIGGAILNNGGSPTLSNLWIKQNTATADGGAMYNLNSSSPVISNVVVENNTANYGGGIFNKNNSSPVMTNVILRNNTANNDGGAMYNDISASPVMTNVTITGNTAKNGAGMYNRTNSAPVLVNTLIANNTANTNGGAIRNEATSSPTLTNVTIANNAGSNALYATDGNTTLNNSIVFGAISGSYTAQNSLIEGNAGGTNGNLDGTVITKDDVFTNASGGDYTLFPCSAVADKGDNSLFAGLNGSTKDLAGNARVYDFSGGGIIDLGAYESQPIVPDANGNVYVTTTGAGTRNGNSWSNSTSKIQCAIDAVGAQKVLVSTGNYNVGSSSYVMKNNVEIYGGFDPANGIDDLSDTRIVPNPTTNTEGSILNGLNTRPLIWNFNNGVNSSAVLDGFTLKNGHSVNGGAIHSRSVSPTFRNLWIKNNTASADGGAIYNENSVSSVISNVTIENNTASYGSGMFNKSSSSPTLTNVIIRNNTANNDGGAMYNDVSASPLMTNVTITGNTAKNGAGIYNRNNSSPVLINTLIANNTANTNGGAIRNEATSSPTLTNVTIANNAGSNAIYAIDGNTTLNNSIVFGTVSASYTAQNSLIEGNAGGTNGNLNGTTVTKADVFTDNANKDYTLKSTAVAVDAGNNTLFAGLNASTKDLAGNARVYNFATAGVIDLGALESNYVRIFPDANGIMYVRENYNGNGASWEHATGSLQGAIDGTGTQKVFVANGNYNAPTNSFVMKNNVEIYGSFDPDNNIKTLSDSRNMPSLSHGGSILNGQNARRVVFNNFTSGSPLNATAVLDGFTVSSGNSTFGSGMYNVYAGPTLRNLVVKNNTATTSGGGIATEYASPTLTNVIISGNAVTTTGAGRGGGMYNYQSNITLQNVIIDNNTVSTTTQNGFGGGMYNVNNAPTFTNVSITNNAVISSSATAVGGGMFNNNTTPTLTNVTIANNRANVGGGITNQSTTISIYNSIFWGNQRSGSTSVAGADIENGTVTLKNSITQVFTTGNATDNNLVGIDPLFVSPTDFRPQETSPAVDGGDNSFFVGLDASTLDLAGNARVYNFAGGGIIDMGAYEIGAKISPLPITLTSFSGSCDDNGIQLSWTTASESNVSHFEIYRSRNGQNWEEVSEIVAVGNSSTSNSYQAIDAKGIETMYYKLRSVDNDGSYQDFNPISIMCNNVNENTWSIYPVPVKNELFVQTQAEQNGVYTLFITDVFGKLVYEKQIDVEVGTNRFAIKTNDLENGTYIIYLNDGITTKLRKFVKVD